MKNIENYMVTELSKNEIVNISGGGISEFGDWLVDTMGTASQTVSNFFSALSEGHAKVAMYHNGNASVMGFK